MSLPHSDYRDIVSQALNDSGEDEHHNHTGKLLGIILFSALLIVYVTVGSYMEIKKFSFGHETGAIILIGMMVSAVVIFVLFFTNDQNIKQSTEKVAEAFKFPNDIFFEVLLPLIIFATGYNMRR